jgi:hypothetical protein
MKIRQSNKFGVLSLDILLEFEHKYSFHLPENYRQFLLEHNGGGPHPMDAINFIDGGVPNSSDVHFFYGIHNGENWASIEWNIKNYKERIVDEGMPIAGDSGGNQYVLIVEGGKAGQIFFWNHEGETKPPSYENMSFIASSFKEFTEKLYEYTKPSEPESKRIVRENDIKGLEQLLNAGYNLESTDEYGRTLIENAAIHNRPEIIQMLFDKGAQLHNAFQLAQQNYKWFKEHKISVDLLEKLQATKGSYR